MINSIVASFTALTLAFSNTGIPSTMKVKCPVGGEEFKITVTSSCSYFGDRTLSLRPISTCDFITRLPQCPKNGLPMYREFNEGEVKQLEVLLQTDYFIGRKQKSRYLIAYELEKELKAEPDRTQLLELLIFGVWYDPDKSLSDSEFIKTFLEASDQFIASPNDMDVPYIKLLMSYPLMRAGLKDRVEAYIAEGESADLMENEVIALWSEKMRSCLDHYEEKSCSPEIIIERPRD